MQRLSPYRGTFDCLDAEQQSERGPNTNVARRLLLALGVLRCVASQLDWDTRTGKPWGSWHEVLCPRVGGGLMTLYKLPMQGVGKNVALDNWANAVGARDDA